MIDSVRARLTLWYVGVLAAVLLMFSALFYAALSRALHARVDDSLASLVDVAEVSLTHDAEEGQSPEDAAQSTVRELSTGQQALSIYSEQLEPLAIRLVEDDITPSPPSELGAGQAQFFTVTEPGDDDAVRAAVRRVQIQPGAVAYVVMATQSLDAVQDELESVRRIFTWAIPVGLVLAGVGGWLLTRRTIAPVGLMAERARRISAEQLDQRLPVTNPRDELGRLALAFNALLDRLTAAIDYQRQFMADASHELRTPLLAIRSAATVTLQRRDREPQEYRDALALVDEQGRRLGRIVEDMFLLARADAGHVPLRRGELYLDELIAEIVRAASAIGQRRGVTTVVDSDGEAQFHGDEEMLRRMISNLVDNAVQHSPDGGTVSVGLRHESGRFRITVTDQGPGVPDAQRERVFDRFFRIDKSRSRAQRQSGGAGLGLAIARWIAEAHGGTLTLQSSGAQGSCFEISLPRSASPSPRATDSPRV